MRARVVLTYRGPVHRLDFCSKIRVRCGCHRGTVPAWFGTERYVRDDWLSVIMEFGSRAIIAELMFA